MMNTSISFERIQLAPCGINCGTCIGYLRAKNRCEGCWSATENSRSYCSTCIIKNCNNLAATESKFCYECEKFPCRRLKQLDKRYSTKYKTSLILNLLTIKEKGITEYLNDEAVRWACPECGSTTSIHRDICIKCNRKLNKGF